MFLMLCKLLLQVRIPFPQFIYFAQKLRVRGLIGPYPPDSRICFYGLGQTQGHKAGKFFRGLPEFYKPILGDFVPKSFKPFPKLGVNIRFSHRDVIGLLMKKGDYFYSFLNRIIVFFFRIAYPLSRDRTITTSDNQ